MSYDLMVFEPSRAPH